MTIAASQNGVRWLTSQNVYLCDECNELIQPGDRMARWTEVCVNDTSTAHFHIKRRYCADCGHLLEDSLTTTEVR